MRPVTRAAKPPNNRAIPPPKRPRPAAGFLKISFRSFNNPLNSFLRVHPRPSLKNFAAFAANPTI
jgi:hypothetical protein